MGFWDTAKRVGKGVLSGGATELYAAATGQGDYGNPMRSEGEYAGVGQIGMGPRAMGQQSNLMDFANTYGGSPFRGQQQQLGTMLMDQARGKNSFAAAKLGQDLGRLQSQQQSMAASASPANRAMAARLGMQNAGELGASMAGQSQLAQVAERNAAAQAAGGLLGQARGQDTESYLGGQNLALQNMLGQQQGQIAYENQRTQRAGAMMGAPTQGEGMLGAVQGGLTAMGTMAASDVRLKKNIRPLGVPSRVSVREQRPDLWINPTLPPEEKAKELERFLDTGAAPYEFEYEGRGLPPGRRTGVMAQNIERVAPDAVIDSPGGKMVDFQKLGPALMASQGYLNRKLEAMKAALGGRDRAARARAEAALADPDKSIYEGF